MPTFDQNDDEDEDAQAPEEPADDVGEQKSDDPSTEDTEDPVEEGGDTGGADQDEGKDEGEEAEKPAPSDAEKKAQAIKDFITKQYGAAADDSGVRAALANQAVSNGISGLGRAVDRYVTARSAAMGGPGPDNAGWDAMRQGAAQRVQQAQAAREAQIKDFLTKQQLGRQAAQDAQKQKDWDVHNAANDPNSKESQVARYIWERANPGMHLADNPNWKSMSANDMSLVKDPIDLKARLDERALAAKQHADWMVASIAQKGAAAAAKADSASDKADAKATAEQNKNYKEMFNKGEGGRGAPQNFTKAQIAQTSVKNAQELLASLPKGPDGQPDYNKMSPQQVHLFNGELEKLATNGSPTEGGRAAQDANTFAQQWAQVKNKFAGPEGDVAGAELGPFIKQSAAYISGLGKVADGVVNSYRRSNYDNYADAGLISEDHKAIYQKKHPELFPELRQSGVAPAGDGQSTKAPPRPNEVERRTSDGRTAVFDATTKKFLRYATPIAEAK